MEGEYTVWNCAGEAEAGEANPGEKGRIILCGDPSPPEKLPWEVENIKLLSGVCCELFCCGGGVRKPCSENAIVPTDKLVDTEY